jgi:hypothetical protein
MIASKENHKDYETLINKNKNIKELLLKLSYEEIKEYYLNMIEDKQDDLDVIGGSIMSEKVFYVKDILQNK